MAADYNKPVITGLVSDAMTEIRENDKYSVSGNEGDSPSNLPTNARRYNISGDKFQSYNGATWDDLVISVAGGGTGNDGSQLTNGFLVVPTSTGLKTSNYAGLVNCYLDTSEIVVSGGIRAFDGYFTGVTTYFDVLGDPAKGSFIYNYGGATRIRSTGNVFELISHPFEATMFSFNCDTGVATFDTPLPVASGGTGASSFTSGYVPYYNGSVLADSSLLHDSNGLSLDETNAGDKKIGIVETSSGNVYGVDFKQVGNSVGCLRSYDGGWKEVLKWASNYDVWIPTGNLSVGASISSDRYSNSGGFYGTAETNAKNHFGQHNAGSAAIVTGWISTAFGDDTGTRVVIGQADGKGLLGAHNGDLDTWDALNIVGEVYFRPSDSPTTGTIMHLTNSGNLGIGMISDGNKLRLNLDVYKPSASDGIKMGDSGNNYTTQFLIETDGSGNPFLRTFFANHLLSEYGYGGGAGNQWKWYTNNTERMTLDTSGNLSIATGDIRIATAGRGIDFSGAGTAANILDDYEEGTWTPQLGAAITDFTSVTYDAWTNGRYVKIGKVVTASGFIMTDSITKGAAAGSIIIKNFPFAAAATTPNFFTGHCLSKSFVTNHPQTLVMNSGTAIAYLYYGTSTTGGGNIVLADILDGASADKHFIQFTITYEV